MADNGLPVTSSPESGKVRKARPIAGKLAERAALFQGGGSQPPAAAKGPAKVEGGLSVQERLAAMKKAHQPEKEAPKVVEGGSGVREGSSVKERLAAMKKQQQQPEPARGPEKKLAGGSIKDRLAAMQQQQQQQTVGKSRSVSDPEPPAPVGGGVKARLAALGGKGMPIPMGPPPPSARPASMATGVASHKAALQQRGGLDLEQLAARVGAPPPTKREPVQEEEEDEDLSRPSFAELTIQRPTVAAGKRRKKTVKKMEAVDLVEPITGEKSVPSEDDEVEKKDDDDDDATDFAGSEGKPADPPRDEKEDEEQEESSVMESTSASCGD